MKVDEDAQRYWTSVRVRSTIMAVLLLIKLCYASDHRSLSGGSNWGSHMDEVFKTGLIVITLIPIFLSISTVLQNLCTIRHFSKILLLSFGILECARYGIVIDYSPWTNSAIYLVVSKNVMVEVLLAFSAFWTMGNEPPGEINITY